MLEKDCLVLRFLFLDNFVITLFLLIMYLLQLQRKLLKTSIYFTAAWIGWKWIAICNMPTKLLFSIIQFLFEMSIYFDSSFHWPVISQLSYCTIAWKWIKGKRNARTTSNFVNVEMIQFQFLYFLSTFRYRTTIFQTLGNIQFSKYVPL